MSFFSGNWERNVEVTLFPGRFTTCFPAKDKWELKKNAITAMQSITQWHEQSDAPHFWEVNNNIIYYKNYQINKVQW